jgi:hypothetical protein
MYWEYPRIEWDWESVELPYACLADPSLQWVDIRIMAFIHICHRRFRSCHAIDEYIAKVCDCSTRTVRRSIRNLEAKGFICIERTAGSPEDFEYYQGWRQRNLLWNIAKRAGKSQE